jgi:class 3 adenylate cyclase
LQAMQSTNVVQEARLVKAETLILSPSGAGLPLRHAQAVASLIPGSTFQQVAQQAPASVGEEVPAIILGFLDGVAAQPSHAEHGRPDAPATAGATAAATAAATAVILFADLVDSTALTERLGDAAFREQHRRLDERLRAIIAEHGGSPVPGRTLGDGVLASFASARHAITAAQAMAATSTDFELPLHLGIHAGDILREDGNVWGGAVNIAARISALSAPNEILVSATVRDLARTSAGVAFEDRGEHPLKGIEDPVRVFAIRTSEAG